MIGIGGIWTETKMKNSGAVSGISSGIDAEINLSLAEAGDEKKPLSFLDIIGSTFAAAIGVQSKANKKRDFTQGKPTQFIFAGLIFATIFVVGVVAIVRAVLSSVT